MLKVLLCLSVLILDTATAAINAPQTVSQLSLKRQPSVNHQPSIKRQSELTHIVKQDCGSCHGMTLKGGLGTPLLPEDLTGKSVDFLTFTIINGRPNTAMPPWREILTDQEAHWIAQQLKRGKFNAK